ncbi:preprotein translocase subunit [Dinoroseobacter shibae DFL 12 = DSM 16493]|jgi:YidC/Oxa1 family membrane protein insertase|uniref:Membrane protein insertase YidC n=1 Tax=Dinoroseobacter shibae (strain DSM 16493 / NCIMB 14021 / DFL 12) TaxID=398580 RepID=YIDC_DINSH|nr:membrane protein insertase YidC [Dinoroseobacter shibae]A8LMA0.1 RecName: Full=Membrane protein insertase YidC; AltName: Full=Foldase YidC; AltName: Full=Membrane integrase YidC; AltName: Full=Membrane protein YidC [Dinoroseobacter shibae DFL 12 = DSM 16493]ABV92077.1 preprotein translocase subunit [Dinoroseobacter shibae DFL 12 = DSM 16493]URF47040.1 membrane protein insertase YidC [Dinoroseobacter shibae]URF51351.1 membrane protein insertase YidC [Dinoroseobacter shibae]
MDDQNKNLILATALSFLVILVWFLLFPPEEPVTDPNAPTQITQSGETADVALTPPAAVTEAAPGAAPQTAATPTENAPRVQIDTPALEGSISLLGGRIDDLSLRNYNETLEPDSPIVRLLSPVDAPGAYYALYGWAPAGTLSFDDVPGANTLWTVESGDTLTVDTPVVLRWENGNGLIFRRTLAVDDDFMFTVTQSVENTTETDKRMQPYGIIARHGEPDTINFFVLHEGVVAMADGSLIESDYDDMLDYDFVEREGARAEVEQIEQNGWIGFTDKNWMTTLIPTPGQPFTSVAKYVGNADIYQTETRLPTQTVPGGQTVTVETRLFAGAKEWEAIRGYERELGIEGFIDSIDWGWFYFLTKPIFFVLHELNLLIGNMGVAIIVLTLLIKALLLPLAWKSYVSMARMKELQPEMEKLKEKAGDDRQKLQVAMMELYKKEKVNPAAGCLPILLQIPIFFSLYKVIFVTIELRHAPFFGPFQDLSAPDPTSIMNLFGLLPFASPEPGSILALIFIGILPLLLGISMWLQQKLNPAPTDPTQAMIFAWLPWVFMFMLGTFASGLIVYWIANNVITFAQQYFIMRRHGYKPDLFGNIVASFKKKKPSEDK